MSAVLMSVVAGLALAQASLEAPLELDGGVREVEPVSANPDEGASQLQRLSGLESGEAADAGQAPDAAAPGPAAEPASAAAAAEPAAAPASAAPDDGIDGRINASLRLSETLVSWLPVDDLGNYVGPRPFETRLRVAPEVHFKGFGAQAEFDAATGAVAGNVPQTLIADRVPVPNFTPLELRQLFLEYRWQSGIFRLGQQASNWGLGLIANNGATDAQAGDFGQARFGSLTYRALLAGRPLFSLGGNWRALEVIAAADLLVRDNTADFNIGDRAFQGVLALRLKVDDDHYAGFYGVYRRQRAVGVDDGGRATDALVLDFAARWQFLRTEDRVLSLGLELAGIVGTTTQSRTDVAPVSQVRQFGAAAKASFRFRAITVLLDGGYASGDQNPYDDQIQGFRFDRDYKVGLVLFEQVLGYQSARAGFRAADPNLTGRPPEGVHLVPTAGAVHNAWYLFPRLKYSIAEWVDLYGGPLFAFSTAKLTDPFSTKIKGGAPENYLGAPPGSYLGTELDLGLQVRWKPHRLLNISGTIEGGILLPGEAFMMTSGSPMGPVGLARARLTLAI